MNKEYQEKDSWINNSWQKSYLHKDNGLKNSINVFLERHIWISGLSITSLFLLTCLMLFSFFQLFQECSFHEYPACMLIMRSTIAATGARKSEKNSAQDRTGISLTLEYRKCDYCETKKTVEEDNEWIAGFKKINF